VNQRHPIEARARTNAVGIRPGGARRAAFTLLESIIAITILTAVVVVCLQVRAQSLRTLRGIEIDRRADLASQSIFDTVIAGALPEPQSGDGVVIWTGDHLGRPYRVERVRVERSSPVSAGEARLAPVVRVFEYRVRYDERLTTFLWWR
jgi:hypothetical protein